MNEEDRLFEELEKFEPQALEPAYPAALAPRIEADPGVVWQVTVPDLPGCNADGATQEEVMTNAVEAVEVWIAARRAAAGHGAVPAPTSLDVLARVATYAGWTWFLVGTRRLTEADRDRVEAVLEPSGVAAPVDAIGVTPLANTEATPSVNK